MSTQKRIMIVIIFTLLLLMIGCSNKNPTGDPHIEGLVFTVSENSILVIEEIDTVDITQEQWQGKPAFSTHIQKDTRIVDTNGKEISTEAINKGDRVKVWHTGPVAESYPMQVWAVKIVVVQE